MPVHTRMAASDAADAAVGHAKREWNPRAYGLDARLEARAGQVVIVGFERTGGTTLFPDPPAPIPVPGVVLLPAWVEGGPSEHLMTTDEARTALGERIKKCESLLRSLPVHGDG